MTPGARLAAAIEVLDQHLAGQPLEKALTNWARRSRFAGSKDRAAVRDLAFDRLRKRNSCAARGGGLTGRGLVLGGLDPQQAEALFNGEGHAPAPQSDAELALFSQGEINDWASRNDMPGWLRPMLEASLGQDTEPVCKALTDRASVFLRVNRSKSDRADAQALLRADGVETVPHDLADTALQVTENPRRVAQSRAYLDGIVELQDAASQALCAGLPAADRMLDYCAGGGGKVLGYGALHRTALFAHDANVARLKDLGPRSARAGVQVQVLSTAQCRADAPFDLVLCDVPCSGSGSWRRAPEGKWRLDRDALDALLALQRDILAQAAALVSDGGVLAYATCSLLCAENEEQVDWFQAQHPDWRKSYTRRFSPLEGGDGFFVAHLTKGSDTQ